MFLVVPEHNTIVIFHHRVCTWLQTKIRFTCWNAGLIGRTVEGLEDKVERIRNGTRHTIAQLGRDRHAMWVILYRRDITAPQRWLVFGCISNERVGGFGTGRMVWACDGHAPGSNITTIATPTGLLCNEERDVVVCVVCSVEAARAEDAAVIEGTIPGALS